MGDTESSHFLSTSLQPAALTTGKALARSLHEVALAPSTAIKHQNVRYNRFRFLLVLFGWIGFASDVTHCHFLHLHDGSFRTLSYGAWLAPTSSIMLNLMCIFHTEPSSEFNMVGQRVCRTHPWFSLKRELQRKRKKGRGKKREKN